MTNQPVEQKKTLNEFQLRNVEILTQLLITDAVSDEVIDLLRESELDYFSLLDKYRLLETKINIDEKTNLLKFKTDYLTNIIKTASRVFYGIKNSVDYEVSFIRFDIDDFSKVNNQYGHDVGDEILIKVANLIRENSRPTDYVIRFGGEEFDVILPSTNLEGALNYLKKLYDNIDKLHHTVKGAVLKPTFSAGVSHFAYEFKSDTIIDDVDIQRCYDKLQQEADNALYDAKYKGKNQYCIFDDKKKDEYSKIRKLYVK